MTNAGKSNIAAGQRNTEFSRTSFSSDTARTLADHLGHEDAVELLQQTLDEESAADEKLTSISMDEILPAAPAEEVARK